LSAELLKVSPNTGSRALVTTAAFIRRGDNWSLSHGHIVRLRSGPLQSRAAVGHIYQVKGTAETRSLRLFEFNGAAVSAARDVLNFHKLAQKSGRAVDPDG